MSRLLVACLAVTACISCNRGASSRMVVIHVLRDPAAQFAERLRRADSEFALTKPRLANGKAVIVATNEGGSFPQLLNRLDDMPPSLLILDSESNPPSDAADRVKFGKAESVCGGKQAYVPIRVSGEEREAVEMYLVFLKMHCGRDSTQPNKTSQ